MGQVVVTSGLPYVGTSNPITPEPLVPVPTTTTTPCIVDLFREEEFADYNPKTFVFAPPAGCKGPWAKVVFKANFTVTAGTQFDRTAAFFLGHTNLYFGTTAEPATNFSPSWHVEKDVTNLTPVFETATAGEADLGNFVGTYNGVDYNGIIYVTAALEFYPASTANPAPTVPDVVIPMPDAAGGPASLAAASDALSQSITLPRNTQNLYLDLYAQSQGNDEFWWLCVPSDVSTEIQTCGNTGFREVEVTVDGAPAGVAPVYPWIYTGGVDPNLWIPTPGVQTLDFKPYRVDLTPFVGTLDDGNAHTVAFSVFNDDDSFSAVGTLYAYEDHGSTIVTGGITQNTLTASPSPVTTENLKTDSAGDITGNVGTTSARNFVISGYVNTSQGTITTKLTQQMNFSTVQTVDIPASENLYVEDVSQLTNVSVSTDTTLDGNTTSTSQHYSYPFTFKYDAVVNSDGSETVTSNSSQTDTVTGSSLLYGAYPEIGTITTENVSSNDALQFDSSGNFTGSSGNSKATYSTNNNGGTGACYAETLASDNYVLTYAANTTNCTAPAPPPASATVSKGVKAAVTRPAVHPLARELK